MNEIDKDIHDALEGVDVPGPRAGFFEQLEAKIEAEPVPAPAPTAGPRRFKRMLAVAAVPIAAAATVAVLIGTNNGDVGPGITPTTQVAQPPSSTPTTELKPLLASDVVSRMTAALSDVKSLKANVTFVQDPYKLGDTQMPGHTMKGELRVRSDGRSYVSYTEGPNEGRGPQMDSYDPATGVAETCWQFQPGTWSCNKYTGVTVTDAIVQQPLDLDVMSAFLRNAVAGNDAKLEEVTFDGRPAWKLKATFGSPGVFYASAATLTVDQETAYPVDVELEQEGKRFSKTTLQGLQVNAGLSDADLTLTRPKGAQINPVEDRAAKPTSIDKVRSLAGYDPFVPDLPAGWELREVFVTKSDGNGGQGLGPEGKDIVSVTYRRGLESVTFTTRRANTAAAGEWSDPLYLDGEGSFSERKVTLSAGAFSGTSVEVETLLSNQHLWGVGSTFVLAIAGDLTPDEMIAAANSLHRYGS
jgi:outer membrane lipoprotein-sorting protein